MPDFYAIRHENGNYLPARYKYPSNWEGEEGQFPRLFTKVSHAKGWITNWRAGRVAFQHSQGYLDEYPEVSLEVIPKPHRAGVKLEIIPVILHFCDPI